MASVEAALIAALLADAEVSALATGGVFIGGGRQGAGYPYITVQRISTVGSGHLTGPSDLDWPRFQIDAWAETGLSAINTAEAIRLAIDSIPIAGSPTFTAIFQDQSGPAPDAETRGFRVSSDYLLFHAR